MLDNCTKHSNCYVIWSPRSGDECPVCYAIKFLQRELQAERTLMLSASKRIRIQQLLLNGFDPNEVDHE